VETTKLPFRLDVHDRYSVLAFTPQLSEGDWGDIDHVAAELLQKLEGMRGPALLVDLSQLSYMGSSQVALVLRMWKVVKAREGRLAVYVTHPLVLEVLKIAGLQSLWTISESREEALQSLGVAQSGVGPSSFVGLVLGLLGLAGAIGGLVVALYGQITLTPETVMIVRYASAGLAAVGGLWSIASGKGTARILGVLILLAAVGLAVLQAMQQAKLL
jgi:anti-anti-sigma factor